MASTEKDVAHISAQFQDENGEQAGAPLDLPVSLSTEQLQSLCNALLQNVRAVIHMQSSATSTTNTLVLVVSRSISAMG